MTTLTRKLVEYIVKTSGLRLFGAYRILDEIQKYRLHEDDKQALAEYILELVAEEIEDYLGL